MEGKMQARGLVVGGTWRTGRRTGCFIDRRRDFILDRSGKEGKEVQGGKKRRQKAGDWGDMIKIRQGKEKQETDRMQERKKRIARE
jgi:hypothetical protein